MLAFFPSAPSAPPAATLGRTSPPLTRRSSRRPQLRPLRRHGPASAQHVAQRPAAGGQHAPATARRHHPRSLPGSTPIAAIDCTCSGTRAMHAAQRPIRRIESPCPAFDAMITQGAVDPLPKIPVLDPRHLAEPFPLPIVFAPLRQAEPQAATDIAAGGDQRDARRLVQCLQAPHDGQQFQPTGIGRTFLVSRLQTRRPVDTFQDKTPAGSFAASAALARRRATGLGKQQEVGVRLPGFSPTGLSLHTLPSPPPWHIRGFIRRIRSGRALSGRNFRDHFFTCR
jgi:hypothetical protein